MLASLIDRDFGHAPPPGGILALSGSLLDTHGSAVLAILYYGSCRRTENPAEGLADLLVVVESYRAFHGAGIAALANRILPPNVYYLESENDQEIFRSKYAVISLDAFENRTRRGRDAYFWARFAQPARIAWVRDETVRTRLTGARVNAVRRFAGKAGRLQSGAITPEEFWTAALAASYRCELRPEPPETAARLIREDQDYYRLITPDAVSPFPWIENRNGHLHIRPGRVRHWAARLDWATRRVWGKFLNVARLFKAAGTFTNGIDYLVWKVERHSGVRIEPTERMRRHPRLAAWGLAWKLWRKGAVR